MSWWTALLGAWRRRHPGPSPPVPFDDAAARSTCRAIWQEELGREIDPEGLAGCLNQARAGGTAETIRAHVRQSVEYAARQARLQAPADQPSPSPRPLAPVRVQGRGFIAAGVPFRPVFTSALSILARQDRERDAFLDWAAATGFNGLRVFCGRLTWAGQAPALALAGLPALLEASASRGLYVLITALTDTRDGGYREATHLERLAQLTKNHNNVLFEVANEPYHGTQSDQVRDLASLRSMADRALSGYPHPWALGAAQTDEPIAGAYPTAGGSFNTSHLDRSRDTWDQVRRVREIYAISEVTGRPAMNSEPMGAAEKAVRGRRMADPSFFFALGALNRGFDCGGGVFHSDDGLHARPLGPVQRACAEAFVAGSRIAPWEARLRYRNAGHAGSPVADAEFVDRGGPIVRAYSFVDGARGITVVLSTTPAPAMSALRFSAGWFAAEELARRPHVTVLRVARA